jgi:GH25 family lysozyme M1 (1,4-beta-N-acetylmuramidase)
VSSWKGKIDWNNVHPRPNLVICQASHGVLEKDDFFPVHWKNLKHTQIARGAQHVFDSRIDGHYQISNYTDTVNEAGGFDDHCIPPVLDLSDLQCNPKKTPLEKRIRQCLDEMEYYSGMKPIIHVNRRFWGFLKDRDGKYPDWAKSYFLWIPWYPSDPELYKRPPKNTFPVGWDSWAMWKYEENATISGINGYVSLSTLSESFAAQVGISFDSRQYASSCQRRFTVEATIVASEGIIIRRQALMNSRMLAFLEKGSQLVGESVELINPHEAWLQVSKPVAGWCPIVHTGKTYLSIT